MHLRRRSDGTGYPTRHRFRQVLKRDFRVEIHQIPPHSVGWIVAPFSGCAADAADPTGHGGPDVGCGWDDMSMQVAEMVGPEGRVVGVDAFLAAARADRLKKGFRISSSAAEMPTS